MNGEKLRETLMYRSLVEVELLMLDFIGRVCLAAAGQTSGLVGR